MSSEENSITGSLQRDCGGQLFIRKLVIFALVFLTAWNLTKVPFYIQYNINGDSSYEQGGLTGSINLEHWIGGFKSSKLRSPACNFLLVHVAFGCTVLIMMALSLIKSAWRKKYGFYFFGFTICLGVHTVPAALMMPQIPLRILFTFTCVMVTVAAVYGFKTLRNYDEDPQKAEWHLFYEYCVITFGSYGAGFAEFAGIANKIKYRLAEGTWKSYGNVPHPRFGKTVYDIIPEKYGMAFFLIFITIFWFWWPIKIIQPVIDTDVRSKSETDTVDESTQLIV